MSEDLVIGEAGRAATMQRLFEIAREKERLDKQLEKIKLEDARLRGILMKSMKAGGIRKLVDPEGEFDVSLVDRKNLVVEDEELLRADLDEMGLMDVTTRLDLNEVKKLSKSIPLSGMKEVTTTSLKLSIYHPDHPEDKIVRLNG